jgi:hypothetical protein
MKWRAWSVGLLACFSPALAAPVDDLASPDPEIRAHAAQLIREQHLYKPPSREPWDKLASTFYVGESPSDVMKGIQAAGAHTEPFSANGWTILQPNVIPLVPLDEYWWVELHFSQSALDEWWILARPKEIFVAPPLNYSGTWHTYRVDGSSISYLYINGCRTFLE